MPNIITVNRRKEVKINRNARGDGVIKIDSDSADILERFLCEANADLSVKELASSMIKYAADDTIIKVDGGEDA
ncbi:hypothetical protein C0033_09000 [Clostridium sp. chh4-2]|uniref:hypothetical protein n=1 Tax=Clostridium sp. chh4-2 TaxID=2067550 RepID=UPI000CCFB2FF|nr:hypothetical protein [Clostridium sp. chh4-2]PNV62240.1 hypothetical protein C0033_09000 [Clostridium sp. chh4-2]